MSELSPFDRRVYGLIREHAGLVRSRDLKNALKVPDRTIRHYLRRLEDAGRIYRPAGRNAGYSASPFVQSLADRERTVQITARKLDRLDMQILRLLLERGRQTGAALADVTGYGVRRMQYRLGKLERLGMARRVNGKKGGYDATHGAREAVALAGARQMCADLSAARLHLLHLMSDLAGRSMLLHSEILAGWLDMPARTVRYHLHALERAGLIERPHARNGGYRLVDVQVRAVLDVALKEGRLCQS
jgi:DNA-binding Lrp family transcriptional regulator